jgi:RNA polymerase sigma factor (sigma-70 family)
VANAGLNRITEAIRAAALRGAAGPTDAELLDRFRRGRDGEAFAALVRRHGRAVLAACRRVLADPADVDDAFQATFLVLVRKIDAIESATVGSWLYAVAHRLAVRARSDARRRAEREGAAARQRTEVVPPEPSWREAVAVLHEELDRLPDAYRRVLLLCYLRGLSREEAAAELGWSPGVVKGQLERGRKMLAARLTRRGIGLSAGLPAVVTGNSAGAGGPSLGLVELTVRAAIGVPSPAVAALARGALPMMNVTKPVLACAVVGFAALVGFALWRAGPPAAPTPAGEPVAVPVPAGEPVPLEGRWRCVGMASDGEVRPRWMVEAQRVTFAFARACGSSRTNAPWRSSSRAGRSRSSV